MQGGGREQAECYFGNTTLDVEGQIGEEARLGAECCGIPSWLFWRKQNHKQHRKQWNQLQGQKADLQLGRERGWGGRGVEEGGVEHRDPLEVR